MLANLARVNIDFKRLQIAASVLADCKSIIFPSSDQRPRVTATFEFGRRTVSFSL